MNAVEFTTEAQVRSAFWKGMPSCARRKGWKQNQYNATIRSEWVEFVDMLQKEGLISEALANKVTL